MQANELRIGNLVNVQNEGIWQWCSGWFEVYFVDDHSKSESVLPIPLTEEWLLKFGFEKHVGYYKNDFFLIEFPELKIVFANAWEYDLWAEIKYVHQLQNLYFALTGKELELKELATR